MKITWITQRHPPLEGGMANSSERLVNGLRDRGFAVTVLLLSDDLQKLTSSAKTFTGNSIFDNINRTLIPGINAPREIEKIYWSAQEVLKDSLIIGFGGDYPGYLASMWGKWLQTGSITLFRGNDFEKNLYDKRKGWLTQYAIENSDIVCSVSLEMTKRLSLMNSKKTAYTPNGKDITAWTLLENDIKQTEVIRNTKFPAKKRIIGLFGQLKSKKGLDIALELMLDYNLKEDTYLLTVGDIPQQYKELIEEKYSAFWISIPFIPKEDLPIYYNLCDIVFIPSYFDGMPNVLLEAMALGKIVVGSKAGGIPDVIDHKEDGFLFEIGDTEEAYEVIKEIFTMTKEKSLSISTKARAKIKKNYTPEIEINNLIKIINELK